MKNSRYFHRNTRLTGHGSTMVETALVLTIALMTFIGIIDIGTVIFRLQGLSERARAGARWGVVNTWNAASIQNVVVYGNSAGTGSPLLGLSTSYVAVTRVDMGDEQVKIEVVIKNYPFKFFTPFLGGSKFLPRVLVALSTESEGSTGV